jgi:hypothetical protein
LGTEAASLDGQSVATWIDREVWPERARILLRFALEAMFCCDLREVSMLLALFAISRCGSLEHMLAVKGGAQERQFTASAMPWLAGRRRTVHSLWLHRLRRVWRWRGRCWSSASWVRATRPRAAPRRRVGGPDACRAVSTSSAMPSRAP